MTAEHFSENGLQFENSRVTGTLRLETQDGSILIEITEGRVVKQDRTPVQALPEVNADPVRSAYQEIEGFLKTLPEGKMTKGWPKDRERDLRINGEESIYGMFPENINRRTQFLVAFLNNLKRHEIRTKSDLLRVGPESISRIGMIGDKGYLLARLLKNALLAEKNSKI